MTNDPFRYPLGRFHPPEAISERERSAWINQIAALPAELRTAVADLDDQQLATPYRPGGWTVRQLVHHIADSHMTAVFRVSKALTEDWPEVPGYDEKLFADLPDHHSAPVEWSVDALEGVHARWVMLLQSLREEQWQRGFLHPENGPTTLDVMTLLYAWHSLHHVAHITHLRAKEEW